MKKIEKAFENKNWNEIKTNDSWQIFKIMAEFVQAFETSFKNWSMRIYLWFCQNQADNIIIKWQKILLKN